MEFFYEYLSPYLSIQMAENTVFKYVLSINNVTV